MMRADEGYLTRDIKPGQRIKRAPPVAAKPAPSPPPKPDKPAGEA